MKIALPCWLWPLIWVPTFTFLASAAQVWTGPLTTFTLLSGADPTLPENQDRITPNVWITRGLNMGIYNAKTESGYTRFSSPADTEWAYGTLANYASLAYTNWAGCSGNNPRSMVGQDAVVHLISDDIYLSVRFTDWGVQSAGGFSYLRSTPAPPSPPPPQLGNCHLTGQTLQFEFTNAPGLTFRVLGATNVLVPIANWTMLGTVTDSPPGSGVYLFADPGTATNSERKCYRVIWP